MIAIGARGSLLNAPSMAASVAGCACARSFPCASPVGKICRTLATRPAITPTFRLIAAVSRCSPDNVHRQRRADDAARELRETRPVGAELELEWNASHHSDREVDPEDAPPETRRISGAVVAAERCPLENHDQERQPHGELGKEVVVRDGEAELEPVPEEGVRRRAHRL